MNHPPGPLDAAVRKWCDEGDLEWVRTRVADADRMPVDTVGYFMPPGEGGSGRRLPRDPWEVHRAALGAVPDSSGRQVVFEMWNEPDFYFLEDLPDRLGVALKAAWWGRRAAAPGAPVLMPSLAMPPGPYFEELGRNGCATLTDGWNFHFYGWIQDFLPTVAQHRRFARRHGWPSSLWLTEAGFAEMPEAVAGDPIQLSRQRVFFERLAVSAHAAGVERMMAFLLTPYVERGLDFGLSDADGASRPALSAYLALAAELPAWRPRWQIWCDAVDAEVGVVLEGGDHEWWTVLWSPHRRTDFGLPPARSPSGPLDRIRQPDPIPGSSSWSTRVRFGPEMDSVRIGWPESAPLPGDGDEVSVTVSAVANWHVRTPARRFDIDGCRWRPWPAAPRSRPGPRHSPGAVVPRILLDPAAARPDKPSLTYAAATTGPIPGSLEAYNFGPVPVTGRWRLRLPRGWAVRSPQSPGTRFATDRHTLDPGTDRRETIELVPPAGWDRRARFTATWQPDSPTRSQETTTLVLAPPGRPPASVRGLPAVAWEVGDAFSGTWRLEPVTPGWLRATLLQPANGGVSSLVAPLPAGLRLDPDDELSLDLRTDCQRPGPLWRLHLVTPGRLVFRCGEEQAVPDDWVGWRRRVGDFSPALWSRAPTGPRVPAGKVRYLKLDLLGLAAGESVELRSVRVERFR